MKLATTDDDAKYDWNSKTCEGVEHDAKILAIYNGKEFVQEATSAVEVAGLVLDKTAFYAEQGGQIYDTGKIVSSSGVEFHVADAQKYAGYVLHVGAVTSGGVMKVGDSVTVKVDF